MANDPMLRDGKRIRLVGGPADGRELILGQQVKAVDVPVLNPGVSFEFRRYRYSGTDAADYIELWFEES